MVLLRDTMKKYNEHLVFRDQFTGISSKIQMESCLSPKVIIEDINLQIENDAMKGLENLINMLNGAKNEQKEKFEEMKKKGQEI